MKRRVWWQAALIGALVLGSQPASAQKASQSDLAKAKMLYEVGVQAFDGANYTAAIKAFTEAYRIAQRPGLVFSIAQAHRKQYYLTKDPDSLREAVKFYREYASKVQQGGRRADVAEALAELEPLAGRLDPTASTAGSSSSATASLMEPTRSGPQLMVSTQTKGAKVSLDGSEPVDAPLIRDVKPGPHKIKVTADEHFDHEREVIVGETGVLPLDIALREKPAFITIETDAGADIAVDGRPVATTPLVKPIEVPAGRHFIAVTKGGHKPVTQDIVVKRGEKKTLPFRLETTGQRWVSYTLLAGGGLGVVVGVLLGFGAAEQEEIAATILAEKKRGNILAPRLNQYNDAIRQRDELRGAAVASLGTGVTIGAAGLLLYMFDNPTPTAPPARFDDTSDKPSPAPSTDFKMEVLGAPVVSPDFVGGSVIGRF
jgi:hypothetical protein